MELFSVVQLGALQVRFPGKTSKMLDKSFSQIYFPTAAKLPKSFHTKAVFRFLCDSLWNAMKRIGVQVRTGVSSVMPRHSLSLSIVTITQVSLSIHWSTQAAPFPPLMLRGYKRSSRGGSSRYFSLFAQIHPDRLHGNVGDSARAALFPPVERHGSPRTRALSGHTGKTQTPAHTTTRTRNSFALHYNMHFLLMYISTF